jgi:hypothetical protein
MGQADVVFCDLFVRLTQGGATSIAEEDAIELTEGWQNSQWPGSALLMCIVACVAACVQTASSHLHAWSG